MTATNESTATTLSVQEMLAQANAAAEASEVDMSESSAGGFGKLYPEGYAFARLVEYVETGKHADEFEGKVKPPALNFRMGFAIWGTPPNQPNGATENYHNDDGSPGLIRTFDMRVSNNEKAGAKIAFDRMNYKGKAKQFYQFLSQPFLIHITQKANKQGKISNRIILKDTLPPHDPATGTPYNIAEAPAELYRLFIWNSPTKEGWDSLYIDGKTDAGKSKNFIQERCMAAVDFEGSPLQQMLNGAGSIPNPEELAGAVDEPAAPAAPTAPATSAPAPTPTDAPAPAAPDAPTAPAAPVDAPAAPAAPAAPTAPAAPAVPEA